MWVNVISLTTPLVLALLGAGWTFVRWNGTMDKRVSHLEQRAEHLEEQVDELKGSNEENFRRLETKLDRIIDHLLKGT